MTAHPRFGHNGGPPLNEAEIVFPEKFLGLFQPYRHKAYYGGRGSAKSHTFATALSIISSKETKRIVCARQFQNSIRDSVKELLESKLRAIGLYDNYHVTEREIVHRNNESRFTFIGLDRNPESAKSLEGADICWVEEARTINARSMEILIPTIRKPGSEMWWSWNPEFESDPVDHYFRGNGKLKNGEVFVPPPRSLIVRVGIEDNPYFYHTTMPDEMEHMRRGNYKRFRHVWGGEYDNDLEGRIFTNVKIGRIEVPDHIAPRYGMDFGFGSDPSAVVKLYVNTDRREIYIAREAYGRVPLRDLPSLIDAVTDGDHDAYIKADSSQPGTIDHLSAQGYNIDGAKKGPGSVKTGITWLQSFRIIIDPDCEDMQEEARLYSWQKDKLTGKRLNTPVDAHNHLWDAVRYATEDAQLDTDDEDSDGGVVRIRT